MSKSAIYTVNSTPTTITPNDIIPLGATNRRFGCNILQDGNTITLSGKGYYLITVSSTITPLVIGNVGITMLKDGIEVIGASATGSVSTVGNSVAIPINAIVRNMNDCDSSIISFVLETTASSIDNFAVSIIKL